MIRLVYCVLCVSLSRRVCVCLCASCANISVDWMCGNVRFICMNVMGPIICPHWALVLIDSFLLRCTHYVNRQHGNNVQRYTFVVTVSLAFSECFIVFVLNSVTHFLSLPLHLPFDVVFRKPYSICIDLYWAVEMFQ